MEIHLVSEAAMTLGRLLKYLGLFAAAAGLLWFTLRALQQPLVIAILPWVGYGPLYVARDQWLPEEVRLRDGKTTNDSLVALQSGVADAACMTLDEMLRARAAGLPLSAALIFDVSAGADTVLARPNIKTLDDLAQKRFGFDLHAVSTFVFEKVLETTGLSRSAITLVDLPPARQLDAWSNHEVDAVITYEPMATLLRREGAHDLFDSRQMPDTIIDVLAVRSDRPRLLSRVQALTAIYFRALEYMRTNEQDAVFRISAREGLTPEEAKRMLATVIYPSLAANRTYLAGDVRLVQVARALSTLMVKRGLLAREDDLAELIMPGALPDKER